MIAVAVVVSALLTALLALVPPAVLQARQTLRSGVIKNIRGDS